MRVFLCLSTCTRRVQALLTAGLLVYPFVVLSATYTVSPTGNDGAAGTAAAPWRTIQHAANTARAGDTVTILAGTYAERVTFSASGTEGKPITFVGTRGANGSWETIVDGSTPVTTWSPAPEIGAGVFKTQLGYSPGAMTAKNMGIWRINDRMMRENRGAGTGPDFLKRGPTEPAQIQTGTVQWWDGVEALFGWIDGTTYLRFRNQQHPSTMQVRAAPGGPVLSINGQSFITVRHLKVQGGQWAVQVKGGAAHTTIDQCYLTHGEYRLLNESSTQTTLSNSTLTYDGIGMQQHPPGDWNTVKEGGQAWVVNRHQYNLN